MDRINQAIDAWEGTNGQKFSNAAFGRAVGVSRQAVGDWRKGRTMEIKGSPLLRAASYLNVNPTWLAEGRGKPGNNAIHEEPATYATSSIEQRLLNVLHAIPSDQHEAFVRSVEHLVSAAQHVPKLNPAPLTKSATSSATRNSG